MWAEADVKWEAPRKGETTERSRKDRGEREEGQLSQDEEQHTDTGQAPLGVEGESSRTSRYTLDVGK